MNTEQIANLIKSSIIHRQYGLQIMAEHALNAIPSQDAIVPKVAGAGKLYYLLCKGLYAALAEIRDYEGPRPKMLSSVYSVAASAGLSDSAPYSFQESDLDELHAWLRGIGGVWHTFSEGAPIPYMDAGNSGEPYHYLEGLGTRDDIIRATMQAMTSSKDSRAKSLRICVVGSTDTDYAVILRIGTLELFSECLTRIHAIPVRRFLEADIPYAPNHALSIFAQAEHILKKDGIGESFMTVYEYIGTMTQLQRLRDSDRLNDLCDNLTKSIVQMAYLLNTASTMKPTPDELVADVKERLSKNTSFLLNQPAITGQSVRIRVNYYLRPNDSMETFAGNDIIIVPSLTSASGI